jgi:hypothetical protein
LSFEIGTLNSPTTLALALPAGSGWSSALRIAPLRHVVILRAQDGQAVEILFLDQRLMLAMFCGANPAPARSPRGRSSSMYSVFCGSSGRQSDGLRLFDEVAGAGFDRQIGSAGYAAGKQRSSGQGW